MSRVDDERGFVGKLVSVGNVANHKTVRTQIIWEGAILAA